MNDTLNKLYDTIENAKKDGVIIHANFFDKYSTGNRQDVSWYEGKLFSIQYGVYLINICAAGDLTGQFEINGETLIFRSPDDFLETCGSYIENDSMMYDFLEEGTLTFNNNNYIEYEVINTKTKKKWPLGCENCCEDNNVYDDFMDYKGILEFVDCNKKIFD